MGDIDEVDFMDGEALTSPGGPLFWKDCSGDKSDTPKKAEKEGKDDKGGGRNAAGAPAGPVRDISQLLWRGLGNAFDLRNAIDQTVFS